MERIFAVASSVAQNLNLRSDDDAIDRLNHLYSGVILVIFSILVSGKQYVGDPLICWLPTIMKDHANYVNSYCWISNTWWQPLYDQIPQNTDERTNKEIEYYQWVPIVLLLQAFLFYVPCLIWRGLNPLSAININGIVEIAMEIGDPFDGEKRSKAFYSLIGHITLGLKKQHEWRSGNHIRLRRALTTCGLFFCGRRKGNYLFVIYIITKLLYLVNLVCQFFVLAWFLKSERFFIGLDLFVHFWNGHAWRESGVFPRVTYCDFEIRVLGNLHRHTVQCVLPINLFNEKIFIFLWFWFALLFLSIIVSIVLWIFRVSFFQTRYNYLEKYLPSDYNKKDEKFGSFVRSYLKVDGFFILKMIHKNCGDLLVSNVVRDLWLIYIGKKKLEDLKKKSEEEDENPPTPSSREKEDSEKSFHDEIAEQEQKIGPSENV